MTGLLFFVFAGVSALLMLLSCFLHRQSALLALISGLFTAFAVLSGYFYGYDHRTVLTAVLAPTALFLFALGRDTGEEAA
ncbi:MAG: hypothetical protein J6U26_01765 [Lachnospiraceae bacterium]|nr:hypothetical protein [Lachnospiraceae bacterium]